MQEVTHMLKAIHAQESCKAALQKTDAVVADLHIKRMVRAANLNAESIGETLNYCAFPDSHWQKIHTNIPPERIMKEIQRRTRVVGKIPDGQSCLCLATARLRYIAANKWSTRKYENMGPLFAEQNQTEGAVA